MITNCTPHDIDVYDASAPDIITYAMAAPVLFSVPTSETVARIAEQEYGGRVLMHAGHALRVPLVEYGHVTGLPAAERGTWFIVSLALALAVPARGDLLVPWRQVRNERGTVIGCRGLARPTS